MGELIKPAGTASKHLYLCLLFTLSILTASPDIYADFPRPGDDSVKPTIVYASIYLTDIDEIDSANQSFVANVYMEFKWQDPGLLKENHSTGTVKPGNIWHPRIQVVNQQKVFQTFPVALEVNDRGTVTYRQRYWGHFSQPLDLREFPMDEQQLSIQVVSVGHNPDEIKFVQNPKEPSGLSDKLSQTEWDVQSWSADAFVYTPSRNVEPLTGFQILINIERDTTYYLVKVIAPLLLIIAMSWTVFWTDPAESGIRISIAITSMLTLIAYRFSIGEMVPKVSYLTRLDFFILGSTLFVFLVLLLVIASLNLANSRNFDLARRLDRWYRIAFPALLLLVTLVPFLMA